MAVMKPFRRANTSQYVQHVLMETPLNEAKEIGQFPHYKGVPTSTLLNN